MTAVAVFSLEARTFEVAAWRGETVAARVPDFAELGKAPDGLTVRFGVLKSVKYAPAVESLQRLEVYDRVKWVRMTKARASSRSPSRPMRSPASTNAG